MNVKFLVIIIKNHFLFSQDNKICWNNHAFGWLVVSSFFSYWPNFIWNKKWLNKTRRINILKKMKFKPAGNIINFFSKHFLMFFISFRNWKFHFFSIVVSSDIRRRKKRWRWEGVWKNCKIKFRLLFYYFTHHTYR